MTLYYAIAICDKQKIKSRSHALKNKKTKNKAYGSSYVVVSLTFD